MTQTRDVFPGGGEGQYGGKEVLRKPLSSFAAAQEKEQQHLVAEMETLQEEVS